MNIADAPIRYLPFPTRERYEETAPRPAPEPEFTDGQKVALLDMRRSDWSKAVLAHLRAFGKADCCGDDYRAMAARGLAVNRGSFHTLTQHGRWRADLVAIEIARAEGMHVVTYHLGRSGPAAKAASARCLCGWSSYATRNVASYMTTLQRHGRGHLEFFGQYVASEAAE
jgi:hypothetical protein